MEQSVATAEEMTATADEVGRSAPGMVSIVDVSSRDLEGVAASAELMHSQMASLETRASRLAQTAAGLRALVTRFQLADAPAEPSPSKRTERRPERRLAS